ncbi:MAG: chitobiase/beta-hexosaminidase C-terminal domain-containing protein [Limisphaerales bacterium]
MRKLLSFIAVARLFLIGGTPVFLAGQTMAQTAFVNFNTPGEYTANFFPWNDNGGVDGANSAFQENATDGVGGSGGVAVFQSTDTTATYKSGSWNLSTNGATVLVSVLIYTDGQSSADKVQLGVMNSTTNGLNSNPGAAFESFRFIPNSATSWGVYEQYRTNNTTVTSGELGTVTVTAGHWYKFVVGITNVSGGTSGNLKAGCALYDYGSSGLTPGASLLTASASHAAPNIATNTQVWPAFRAFADAGISAFDNFLVFQSNSPPVFTLDLTNALVSPGGDATFAALADGPGTISYAWHTNSVLVPAATGSAYTASPVSAGLTNVIVVAMNENGTATNSASVGILVPKPPRVTNLPATGISATGATLNGQVVSTGGAPTSVLLYYGPADGGANAAAWSNSVPLGLEGSAFALSIASLSSNTTYYFTSEATNSAGAVWAMPSLSFTTPASNPVPTLTAVPTFHNDNTRWGVNSNETILTLANVNTNSFGKLFNCAVDGFVYAQPLIMTNVNLPGRGTHNVVFVATEHDSVYAFDADNNTGATASPLWHTSFLGTGVTTVPAGDVGTADITPEIGITSTPVIDPVTGTIYLEVKTLEHNVTYVHRLHALDITTGLERTDFQSPAVITCTNYPGSGTGDNDGKNPPHVLWNPLREHSRPALTLLNGAVYMSFASHGDNQPYHGWLFAYNATNVSQQLSAYNTTPNGGEGGFWDGGGGPSVDAAGNLYLQSGNGTFDGGTGITTVNDYSMSLMKFSTTNGLKLADYFAPADAVALSDSDQDLGASAPVILPDSAGSTAHPHLVVGGGKTAPIYLVDRDNMGRFNGVNGANKIVQQFNGGPSGDRDVAPAFYSNTLYIIDSNSRIGAYKIANGLFNTTPVESPDFYDNKGGATVSISANGASNAIAWAVYNTGGESPTGPCVLRAYNAKTMAELYTSDKLPARDSAGVAVKFTVPTIANGKVYVGAQYSLTVYGEVEAFVNAPVISPAGGIYTNSVTVSLSDATAGAAIYYTLDGTTPTTNSTRYTGPFVLTNSVLVTAEAFQSGAVPSGPVSESFINISSVGTGTGLLGQYWANTTSAAFISSTFNAPPALTRVDPTINFDWSTIPPAANIGPDTYCARWTGSVQPQFSGIYTFYTDTDDGTLLWVNGQLLVNAWEDQGPTTWSGQINLVGQERYNIEMEYFQDGGGAQAQLYWSSPLQGPMTIIPESQLYPETNPPPSVALTAPTNGASYTAGASVSLTAEAAAQYNSLSLVEFYLGGNLLGSVSNPPYSLTVTGLAPGSYSLTAVAVDGSGLTNTSVPVNITVNPGSGQPYGLTNVASAPAFYNMPPVFSGALPPQLSLTGVFSNTPAMAPSVSLIPYAPNVPLWSDGAQKVRYFSVPNSGAPLTPGEQIAYAPAGTWSFPAGTVFVKTFELLTNQSDPGSLLRLETRLLVRDTNGAVYGVTYKWRADNSDADLLTSNLTEAISIATPNGVTTQLWYYPSPSDCLLCHTAVANYVLGVNARQLNGSFAYPNGVADNQLRSLNRAGLFYPAMDESQIPSVEQLSAVTNTAASYAQRARSYLDANCAQCHQPGGSGPTFDARYDTPLASQNIINTPAAKGNLGYDNVNIVTPNDVWRSSLYDRMDVVNPAIQMPPLARNLIDTNAVQLMADWINSLGGTPALPPPTVAPAGGMFEGFVNVTLQPPAPGVTIYYTLDGSLPTTNSQVYALPFALTNSATVNASAWEAGYVNSVVGTAQYTILPGIFFLSPEFAGGAFQMTFAGPIGSNYILQVSTNLTQWTSISTNTPATSPFTLSDPSASGALSRFYRVLQEP